MRMPAVALVLVGSALAQESAAAPHETSHGRGPNVVLVVADDLGYGELGCYGQQRIATPNLDRMARDGMRFVQHYCGAPVCAPSRCVLMTGRSPGHATIRDNVEVNPEGQLPIGKDEITLAEVARAAGCATGCFGKWGLGAPGSEGDPLQQGFQRFYGYNCQRHAHSHYPTWLYDDAAKVQLTGNDGKSGSEYAPDLIVAAARAFVRAHRDEPFFLFVPLALPHLALQAPDAAIAPYRGKWDETPYTGASYLPHATPRACYAAMVTGVDRAVGELLAEIEAQHLAGDTLVLFTSDNGPTHLEEQVDVRFFASSGGLRGLKGSVYEGGIRVPLLARWPGRIAAGVTAEHVCRFEDVLPTLAALHGQAVPTECDGVSLLPTLLGAGEQRQHDYLLWDFPGYGGQIAVRQGRWKAVWRGLRADPDAAGELYDLEADRAEQKDRAAAEPEVFARLDAIRRDGRTEPAIAAFRFGRYGASSAK